MTNAALVPTGVTQLEKVPVSKPVFNRRSMPSPRPAPRESVRATGLVVDMSNGRGLNGAGGVSLSITKAAELLGANPGAALPTVTDTGACGRLPATAVTLNQAMF